MVIFMNILTVTRAVKLLFALTICSNRCIIKQNVQTVNNVEFFTKERNS